MTWGVFQQCKQHIIRNMRWLFIQEIKPRQHFFLLQHTYCICSSLETRYHINKGLCYIITRVLRRTYPLIYLQLIDLTLISCIGTKQFTSLGSSNLANLSFCLCVTSFDYNAIPLEKYIKNIKNVYSSRPAIMFYPQLSINIIVHEAASTTL